MDDLLEDRMKTEIIYEDNELLVVHKPAGLATQTAKAGQADTVRDRKSTRLNSSHMA